MNDKLQGERERFEAWLANSKQSGTITDWLFHAWQAGRAALASDAEPKAWRYERKHWGDSDYTVNVYLESPPEANPGLASECVSVTPLFNKTPSTAQAVEAAIRKAAEVCAKGVHQATEDDDESAWKMAAWLKDQILALIPTEAAQEQAGNGTWIPLTQCLPDSSKHDRVLIYTEGIDFAGEQFFDVTADSLNECFYESPEEQPEVCRAATHWMARPFPTEAAQDAKDAKDAEGKQP